MSETFWMKGTFSDNSVNIYTPMGKKKQGKFALEVAAKTLLF